MKYWILLVGVLLSTPALADSPAPIVPLNQHLATVDYFSNGRQTGCGLRATGETPDGLSLNILITVFRKETGAAFGVFKAVARKTIAKHGKADSASPGKLQRAWVTTGSGKRPMFYKDEESAHSDAYMVNSEFSSTADLLTAMLQENFIVGLNFKSGINRQEDDPDELFQFDQHVSPEEEARFSVCMRNLRATQEQGKRQETF
ncbi:MAG: hypothetical protein HY016_01970 [Nitrosomonadales bacterium]|nr:hypothetical protein [Nitrosomonadales bacterium]